MSTRTRTLEQSAAFLAALAALAVGAALLSLGVPAAAQQRPEGGGATDVDVERFAGTQRYHTARLIAEATFDEAGRVVVAKAEDWPDALAGTYLAGLLDAPVLLTSRTAVQADTLAALEALDATQVVILGGHAAISAAVDDVFELEGYDVLRVFGATRYETSAELALSVFTDGGDYPVGEWDGDRTAVVATGQQFADALVSGTVAFSEHFPVLLTPTASLHPAAAEALAELDIERVIIPGGVNAVSARTQAEIAAMGIATTRVSIPGTGRWETAIAFAEFAIDQFGYTLDHVNVATGFAFADALTMAPHAGVEEAPLLLTPGTQSAPTATLSAWLRTRSCEITSIDVAGGVAAVSRANEDAIAEAADACEEPTPLTITPRSGAPGTRVLATFSGFASGAIRSIDMAGRCVQDGNIFEVSDGGGTGEPEDLHVPFVVLAGAADGDCPLTFTLTLVDGSTVELETAFVVAGTRASVSLDADNVASVLPITGAVAGSGIARTAVAGDCIVDIDDLEPDAQGRFTIWIDDADYRGACDLTFTVVFADGEVEVFERRIVVTT